jgi:hypothetical protein
MATVACPHCSKAVVIPDSPVLPAGIGDMCKAFPELCALARNQSAQLNTIAKTVANIPNRNEHPAPSESVIKGWLDCPDCKPKFEALLKRHPELFRPEEDAEEEKPYAWMH